MKNNKPLEGIKIIEISTIITASLSAMMLADQGAEVVKIEQTGFGDPLRYLGTQKGGISAIFANVNRGKSSVELDLKKEADLNFAKKLISEADVLLNNFRPGVMKSLGISKEECKKLNEDLIYVSITGFGKKGSFSNKPAYDHVVQAMSGATAIQSDLEKPQYMKTLLCDKITAYTATQSICSALYKRERTGEASSIDLSMLDASMFFLWPDGMMNHTLLDDDVQNLPPLTAAYNMYECKDGSISIAAMLDKHWHGIFKAVDKPELIDDERYSSAAERSKNFIQLLELVSLFKNYSVDEMFNRLTENDVPCSKNLTLEQAITNQQVKDNDLVTEQNTETQGMVRMIRYPALFDEEKLINNKPAPKLGEDNKKLLK
jgi:crotonobetainyl-CoA:carnitine CoA-transferase CaiB-like acyl-CoA transferase